MLQKPCRAALKYYNTKAGDDFHQVKVLMLAPTGKAGYNIKGNTIHSALAIPACQSLKDYKPLDSSRLNTLRCQLGGVKLIYIDFFFSLNQLYLHHRHLHYLQPLHYLQYLQCTCCNTYNTGYLHKKLRIQYLTHEHSFLQSN